MTSVTTVDASGIAESFFDEAQFNVVVRGPGKSGPEAKSNTQQVTKKLFRALNSLKEKGISFNEDALKTSFSIEKQDSWNERLQRQVFAGYLANFNLVVTTKDMEHISEIHDALTSVEGAEVDSPTFTITPEHKADLHQIALKKAWNVVKNRFAQQCDTLEIDANTFEVSKWNVNYRDRAGGGNFKAAMLTQTMDKNEPPIKISSGKATVQLTLSAFYSRKEIV